MKSWREKPDSEENQKATRDTKRYVGALRLEAELRCKACNGSGMIRNDQSNQGWDDCPHCADEN